MSNLQISIIGGLALWVLLVLVVCLILGANRRMTDQRAESVHDIVQASQPMPLESAYIRGVQAGARRHVRAGSIE